MRLHRGQVPGDDARIHETLVSMSRRNIVRKSPGDSGSTMIRRSIDVHPTATRQLGGGCGGSRLTGPTESAEERQGARRTAHPRPPSRSARQTGSWYGQADDEALRFPVLRDFSCKLACNRCPDQKFTESLLLRWRVTAGRPCSVQTMMTSSPWFAHWIWICPLAAKSAPCFAEFVANS